ncbi:MAG TPA: sigma factor [Mycobacteriales bacterium]|jgi:Sigma-70 region 2.
MGREPDPRFLYLVEDHGGMLLRAARLLCGDWARAEDLLQQTLARALIRWDRRRPDLEVVLGVQRELVATYLDELPELDQTADNLRPAVPTGPLLCALRELEPMVRATVVGRYYLELSDRDIAELISVEPGRARHVGIRTLAWLDRRTRFAGVGPG